MILRTENTNFKSAIVYVIFKVLHMPPIVTLLYSRTAASRASWSFCRIKVIAMEYMYITSPSFKKIIKCKLNQKMVIGPTFYLKIPLLCMKMSIKRKMFSWQVRNINNYCWSHDIWPIRVSKKCALKHLLHTLVCNKCLLHSLGRAPRIQSGGPWRLPLLYAQLFSLI